MSSCDGGRVVPPGAESAWSSRQNDGPPPGAPAGRLAVGALLRLSEWAGTLAVADKEES